MTCLAPKLSIVAPCYNEQAVVEHFHRRVTAAANAVAGDDYELIVVNDGSTDATWTVLSRLFHNDDHVAAVNLSRRHGQQLALTAGLALCRGERVLTIDSDLQDPPELLKDLWQVMESENADVVYARRKARLGETWFKRGSAALFYRLLRRIGYADIPENVGDFRLMSRRVVEVLKAMPEQNRFIRGMVGWIGFTHAFVDYDREPRFAGKSEYSMSRMVLLALDALTGFSIVPLRMASYAGLLVGAIGLTMLSYTLGSWLIGRVVDGWTSLTTIVLIIGSLQLMLIGLLGEYVGRMFLEVKHRPLFTFEEVLRHEPFVVGATGQAVREEITARSKSRPSTIRMSQADNLQPTAQIQRRQTKTSAAPKNR